MQTVWYHILPPVGLGLVMNGLIYSFRLYRESKRKPSQNPWIPPGYVIGTIWIILLGCMGKAHYLLTESSSNTLYQYPHTYLAPSKTHSISKPNTSGLEKNLGIFSLDFLILFSLLYPVFTGLKDNDSFWLLASLVITLTVSTIVRTYSMQAFYYLLPLAAWVSYVNFATFLGQGLR